MKIITGMHRSGTSLVARLVHKAGADMGSPETFYPADQWNPGGYYEQKNIHEINMPLINGIFWKFSYFFLPSRKTIIRRSRRFESQIRQIGAAYHEKVVKENRFCLTLPAWQRYNVNIEKVLICIRSPEQVVGSIMRRNHTTRKHGYYLWRVHNQRILKYAETIPTWIIDYNNLLSVKPFKTELTSALEFLDVDFSKDNISNMQREIVRTEMNHHTDGSDNFPDDVHELWNTLKMRHKDQFIGKVT